MTATRAPSFGEPDETVEQRAQSVVGGGPSSDDETTIPCEICGASVACRAFDAHQLSCAGDPDLDATLTLAKEVHRAQELQRVQADRLGFSRGDPEVASRCALCVDYDAVPSRLRPHPVFDFCVCPLHLRGLRGVWLQDPEEDYERPGVPGFSDAHCTACGEGAESGVINCDVQCNHPTCGAPGSRCRLAFCHDCLDRAWAGDHRDETGRLRSLWRCPACRVPREDDDPPEDAAHDDARGETLPVLREGWLRRLADRRTRVAARPAASEDDDDELEPEPERERRSDVRKRARVRIRPAGGGSSAREDEDVPDEPSDDKDDDEDPEYAPNRRRFKPRPRRIARDGVSESNAIGGDGRGSEPGSDPYRGCSWTNESLAEAKRAAAAAAASGSGSTSPGPPEQLPGPLAMWEGVEFGALSLPARAAAERYVVESLGAHGVRRLARVNAYPCFARMLRGRLFAVGWSGQTKLRAAPLPSLEEMLGVEELPRWWASGPGRNGGAGEKKQYVRCVDTIEVTQSQLTQVNALIMNGANLDVEVIGTNLHRKTVSEFIRSKGLTPVPGRGADALVQNPPAKFLAEDLFGFDPDHLALLSNSGLKRRALGESIQTGVLEHAFEPLMDRWDDDAFWGARGCLSPKSSGGWSLWVLCDGVGAVPVAFHRAATRRGQRVRLVVTSEWQINLNAVVAAWATGEKVRGRVHDEPFHPPRPRAAGCAHGAETALVQLGSLTDEDAPPRHFWNKSSNWMRGARWTTPRGGEPGQPARLVRKRQPPQSHHWASPAGIERLTEVWGTPHVVAGTTPCNNNTGSNRGHSKSGAGREGFDGRDSKVFKDFVAVLRRVSAVAAAAMRERDERIEGAEAEDVIVLD